MAFNKFHNSTIFMVSSINPNVKSIYINSTINYKKHKQQFYKDYYSGSQNKGIFQYIRDHGGIIEWHFTVLENFT
jgi:hypothetical protein